VKVGREEEVEEVKEMEVEVEVKEKKMEEEEKEEVDLLKSSKQQLHRSVHKPNFYN
jgi:hypothetical protein